MSRHSQILDCESQAILPPLGSIGALVIVLLFPGLPLAAQEEPVDTSSAAAAAEPESAPAPEYRGPAILGRSNQPAIGTGSRYTTIQPFLSLSEIYDTGLGVSAPGEGVGTSRAVTGLEAGFGLTGVHRWKNVSLSVQYEGNYRRYSQSISMNGLDQFLSLTAVSPLKRHLIFSIRQTVGTVTQGMGSFVLQPDGLNSSIVNPSQEPFDNRMRFFDSIATISYQKSSRVVLSASAQGSIIRRELARLVGTNTVGASADASYRLSRRATIGIGYRYDQFSFTTFGGAGIHSLNLDYSWRMTKSVDVAIQGGMAYGSVLSLAIVPVDLRVAQILGISSGLQVSNQILHVPIVGTRITKSWRRASADIAYQRGVSPGNGLVLTSMMESLTVGFSYSNPHGWGFSVIGGRSSMNAFGTAEANYTGYTGGVSVTRVLRPGVQAFSRFEARPFSYMGVGLQSRAFYRAVVGFTFSPSEVPIGLK
jgi:hypothetical protein